MADLRKHIRIDMDGTLALFHETFIVEFNATNPSSNYTIEDFHSYDKWNIPITFEQFSLMYNDIWKKRWKTILPSIDMAAMYALTSAHDVEIVTKRPEDHAGVLKEWTEWFFPGLKMELRTVKSDSEKVAGSYDVLFDDAPPVAEAFLKSDLRDTTLFFVKRPWNSKTQFELQNQRILKPETMSEGVRHLLRNGEALVRAAKQKRRNK